MIRVPVIIRKPTPQEWLNGFIGKMVDNCAMCLRESGYLVINICDVPTYKNLTRDFVAFMAKDHRFERQDNLFLMLSKMLGTRKEGETYKSEPVFVFRRK